MLFAYWTAAFYQTKANLRDNYWHCSRNGPQPFTVLDKPTIQMTGT